ncbi:MULTISPECIES: hypothetical protein [unclassified Sphingobacterium]|uniref:DUF7009 family protein n=1 Tax=unclassified Sphingobacterium TaxID=2609468 RepID=UPI0020C34DC7|nr:MULTISPECIES: hypothetical protein [unclassified Sphingobacterium]
MKIRIKDNSVRIRLTQSEVNALYQDGNISSRTEFLEQAFVYAVERADVPELSVEFVENKITLKIPANLLEQMYSTDVVGFEGLTGKVKLLLEKDFVCLDNTLEDQSDNYPNPNMKC